MTVVETISVFALIPLAIYGVIMLLTLWPRIAHTPRYRPGQPWDHPSVWWSAQPLEPDAVQEALHAGNGSAPAIEDAAGEPVRTARGGARGSW